MKIKYLLISLIVGLTIGLFIGIVITGWNNERIQKDAFYKGYEVGFNEMRESCIDTLLQIKGRYSGQQGQFCDISGKYCTNIPYTFVKEKESK